MPGLFTAKIHVCEGIKKEFIVVTYFKLKIIFHSEQILGTNNRKK